jgi:hypothetical protein
MHKEFYLEIQIPSERAENVKVGFKSNVVRGCSVDLVSSEQGSVAGCCEDVMTVWIL